MRKHDDLLRRKQNQRMEMLSPITGRVPKEPMAMDDLEWKNLLNHVRMLAELEVDHVAE